MGREVSRELQKWLSLALTFRNILRLRIFQLLHPSFQAFFGGKN